MIARSCESLVRRLSLSSSGGGGPSLMWSKRSTVKIIYQAACSASDLSFRVHLSCPDNAATLDPLGICWVSTPASLIRSSSVFHSDPSNVPLLHYSFLDRLLITAIYLSADSYAHI